MINEVIYEPSVGDWVKCVGGTAAVGEVGRIIKVTAKRVVVFLFLSQEARNKSKAYVQKVSDPNEDQGDAKKTGTDGDATGEKENEPPSETSKKSDAPLPNKSDSIDGNGNVNDNVNILITVSEVKDSKTGVATPGLTQENKGRFLAAAGDHLEGFSSQDMNKASAIDGRGMILRNMRQMIFKTTSPKIASSIVSYYLKHDLSIEGVICHVSYAEKSPKFDDKGVEARFGVANSFSSNNNKRFGNDHKFNRGYNHRNKNGRFGNASGRGFQNHYSSANKQSYGYASAPGMPERSIFNRMKPAKN